jgi:WD40 repeat protein
MYKKYFYLTISYVCILLLQTINGSEQKNGSTPKKFYKQAIIVSPIANPTSVIFLPNNSLAIAGQVGLIAYDLQSQKISIDHNLNIIDIAANPQRTYLATSTYFGIKAYDIIQQKRIFNHDIFCEAGQKIFIAISSGNKLIAYTPYKYIAPSILFYDFNENHNKPTTIHFGCPLPDPNSFSERKKSIIIHSTQNYVLFPRNSYAYDKMNIEEASISLALTLFQLEQKDHIIGIEYNNDGTLIAINERNKGCLLFENEQSTKTYLYHSNAAKADKRAALYPAMAFGPNNILALLSWENTIQFWDCNTKQLLFTALLDDAEIIGPQQSLNKRLSFSLDGTQLAIALKNKCFVFFMPPAMHASKIRTTLLYSLWVLSQLSDNSNKRIPYIPYDIIGLILKNIILLNQVVTTAHDQQK